MLRSAGTGLVDGEKLPENTQEFIENTLKARLMAKAGTDNLSAAVTDAVTVLVSMTRCRFGGDDRFAADAAFGSFTVFGTGCRFTLYFGKLMNMCAELTQISFSVLLSR